MNDTILNIYGDVATIYDCSEYHTGDCSGDMTWFENPNTGNRRMLCEHHADKAYERQERVHREYLNDTVSN